jgi:RHS repeat-associated protein
MGRRVQKVIDTYSSGAWVQDKEIQFIYDGWNLVKETTIAQGGSSVDKYYVWGLDLSQSRQGAGGVGGLLAAVDGSLTYQYLYDANGNVGQVVDAADGSIAARYEYDPYGNLVDQGGAYADVNPYRFSTKYYDKEVNIYYYGLRFYSPAIGEWINRDPLDEDGGLNLSEFLENSSVNLTDFLGLSTIVDARKWNSPYLYYRGSTFYMPKNYGVYNIIFEVQWDSQSGKIALQALNNNLLLLREMLDKNLLLI